MASKRKKSRQRRAERTTQFSARGYRELSAARTEEREREFSALGFPPHGPSLGDEDEIPTVPQPIPSERSVRR